MAGWTEVPTLARKCQKILKAAVSTFDTSKAIVQDTAIKIAIDHLSHIRSEKAILPFKALFIDLFKSLKMVFDTPVIGGIPRIARPVDRRNVGHGLLPFFIALFKAVVMVVKQPPQWRPLSFPGMINPPFVRISFHQLQKNSLYPRCLSQQR
jgi:hypothetical protein